MMFKRFMAVPTLAWFTIILLMTIVAVPPTYLLVSDKAAVVIVLLGEMLAMLVALNGMMWDMFKKRLGNRQRPNLLR